MDGEGWWEKMVWHGKKRADTLGGDRVEGSNDLAPPWG